MEEFHKRTAPSIALAMSELPPYSNQQSFGGSALVMTDVLERLVQLVPGLSSALNRATFLTDAPLALADWTIWDARVLPDPTDPDAQDMLLTALKSPPDPITAQARLAQGQETLAKSVLAVVPSRNGSQQGLFPWQATTFAPISS